MNSKEDAKAQIGGRATGIWLVGGVILFLVDGGLSHLFSLRAAAFLGIGMFAAAIIVGGVSYLIVNAMATRLAARYPDPTSSAAQAAMRTWRSIFGIANTVLAILFLLWVYASFFRYQEAPPPTSSQGLFHEVHCKEPLPVFTLGANSNPTKDQESALCTCIWNNLGRWERETSEKIAQGKESEISWLNKHGFPDRFGSALEKCGGMKL